MEIKLISDKDKLESHLIEMLKWLTHTVLILPIVFQSWVIFTKQIINK